MAPPAELSKLQHLPQDDWLPRQAAHQMRVRRYADPYLARRSAGQKHPVEDFLFTYYTQKPGQLLRWHAGAGVVLSGPSAAARASWKYYRVPDDGELAAAGLPAGTPAVTVDVEAFARDRRDALQFAGIILAGTAARPAQFGCFGLHEWAMVYRQDKFELRHEYLQLRLGSERTDQVVEENRIRCSHFDAFRFYTPDAVPLNSLAPSRENQRTMEQPGCLHANMDLYKWAYKLAPLLPSELVMDCFELSWRIRAMDMQASPYDLKVWGYPAILIETPEGKAEYVEYQRAFSAESQELRQRLLRELSPLLQLTGSARNPPRKHGRTTMTAAHDSHRRHEIDLTVRLTEAPGAPEYVFRLAASGGALAGECTLPDSAAALAAVEQHGEDIFFPKPGPPKMCTQQYGGPQVAVVTGWFLGREVNSRFSRTDGCEIARWRAMAPLLGGIAGSTGAI